MLPINDFQLFLDNGYCSTTIENLSMQKVRCRHCDSMYDINSIICLNVNGVIVYEISITTTNPNPYSNTLYGALNVPNGQGFFVPSTIPLEVGTNNQLIYFYPMNNFNGGEVIINMQIPMEDLVCFTDTVFDFPVCNAPRITPSEGVIKLDDLLVVAPNPSRTNTTVFYSYLSNPTTLQAEKAIEVVDMLGRKILTLPLKETKGSIDIDTFGIASGQYMVVMKENGTIIKSVKLIVQH